MRAPQWHLPFFEPEHQALAQGLHTWCPSQEVDERDDRQACREWVQRPKKWLSKSPKDRASRTA